MTKEQLLVAVVGAMAFAGGCYSAHPIRIRIAAPTPIYESYWGGRGVYHPSGARLGVLEPEECVLAVDMEDSKDPSIWKVRDRLGVQGWIFPDRGKWHFGCDADARN